MWKIIFSVSLLFLIPGITSAAAIHGVNVPNECLSSLAVQSNATINNLSGFPLWTALEGERCDVVEKMRAEIFINGVAKPDNIIHHMTKGIQSWIKELEQKKAEVENDLANAPGSTRVAGNLLNSSLWTMVGVTTAIEGCSAGSAGGHLGCGIGAIAAMAALYSTSKDVASGIDWSNNMKKLRNRLDDTVKKLKVARTELENLPINEIKEPAKRATENFVEMCRLVQANCN